MTFEQIQDLIKLLDSTSIGEFKIEQNDLKLCIRTGAYVSALQEGKILPPAMMSFTTPSMNVSPSLPPLTQAVVENSPPPPPPQIAVPTTKSVEPKSDTTNLVTIKSSMIGTFYRKPGPDKEVFVKIGDTITKGTVLCVIEAMKLYNEIESEITGTIVKILVDDGASVEYDQPIFLVQP